MKIKINEKTVIEIAISDIMRKDYEECQNDVLVGSGCKICGTCSLDIPVSSGICLADILNNQSSDWRMPKPFNGLKSEGENV